MPAPQAGKPKGKRLVIGIIVSLVVLLGIGFFSYSMLFSPDVQAKKAASAYLSAATTGNKTELYKLDEATTDSDKKFDDNLSDSMKGSFKLKESGTKDGKWFYLFELNGAKSKRARAVVEKKNGKYVVNSIVIGGDALVLFPGTAQASATSDTPATTTTPASCIVQDDYKYANYDKQPSSVTYDSTYGVNNYVSGIYFEPDKTVEVTLPSSYDNMADFATHAAAKQWKIHLVGSIKDTVAGTQSAAGVQLAQARSQKVKDQLVQRGVPADRIIIDPPHDYSNEDQNHVQVEVYRRVDMFIDPTCTAK